MTLQELITRVAVHSGESKKAVDNVLRTIADLALDELRTETGEIPLPGIGKIKATTRAARKGVNPATGAEIDIPAKNTAKLVLSKTLLDAIA